MEIKCTEIKGDNYKRYEITDKNVYGYCVIEKYSSGWNLELMGVIPKRKGYGSILLDFVRKDMSTNMTVCPVTETSIKFFKRHGMNDKYILPQF